MDAKKAAGEAAAEFVEDGMTIGLGTGSTVYWTIVKLAGRVREGLRIKAVPTSEKTEALAQRMGIPMIPLSGLERELDVAIDGADEANSAFELVKGGGGALLREKMIAAYASRFIIVVDHTKCVGQLGKFPLPVEVVRYGWGITARHLAGLGCRPVLREDNEHPFVTDNGNFILDCHFQAILDPAPLHDELNGIPGVVENGLFVGMADDIVVGHPDGTVRILGKNRNMRE
jgi:ribose 5-phosphate isomerase A